LVAVEFDGDTLLRPAAVDTAAAGLAVGDRKREPFFAQELEKSSFELAKRDANISMHDSAELLRPGAGRSADEHGLDCRRRSAVADPSLVAGTGECIDRQPGGDVDQRAWHDRHGNPVEDRGVAGVEEPRPVGLHPLNAPFRPGDDLRCRSRPLHEPQQMCARSSAQERALPGG
jgi:hypothetical protein